VYPLILFFFIFCVNIHKLILWPILKATIAPENDTREKIDRKYLVRSEL
jgi:hypothetical protein